MVTAKADFQRGDITLSIFRLLIAVLLLLPGQAHAQAKLLPAIAAPSASPPTAAVTPGITPAQAQSALEVLTNDARRAEFVATLQTIVRAQGVPPAGSTTNAGSLPGNIPLPLAPNSLGAELLTGASTRVSALSGDMVSMVQAVTDFPLLSRWVSNLANNTDSQRALLDAAWKLAVIFAAALVIELAVRRLLRRPIHALERHAPEGNRATDLVDDDPEVRMRHKPSALTLLQRLPFVFGRFALDVGPILLFVVVANAMLGTTLGAQGTTRQVVLAVVNAYAICRVVTAVTRMLVSPNTARLRLIQMSDEDASYIQRWVRRIASVAIFGYAATEVALLFGLYLIAHDALLKLVALAVHVMLAIVVLQSRHKVARRIGARPGATGVWANLRNRLARSWHWIAVFYIIALWLVWAFEVQDGVIRLVRFFVAIVVVSTVARLVAIAALGGLDRALRVSPETLQNYPGLVTRARSYHPVARAFIKILLISASVVVLFEAWGIDSFAWFERDALGGRVLSALMTIGATLLAALVIWEALDAIVQRHLDRLTREAQFSRSARLRTLLPMLRTTVFAAIALFAGLMVLTQIGVNIAPLLAGAGVIGIAIGFGSQKLVQDVITGLFLLLENAMQVGDVVSLGGLSGTVENLSIRTIRLRALDGAVHIVPFSAVTSVTNMTRDFGYALLDISVGLNEEANRISDLLCVLVQDMRAEPRWESALRDDLEVMGVEKFVDLAWVLRIRVKTLPNQRWAVGRELNRRIKAKFDELAIESPFTSFRALSAPLPPPVTAPAPTPEIAESHA